MKISQLQHGEACTLLLAPESSRAPAPTKGQEVRLVFPRSGDDVLLTSGSITTVVVAVDEVTRRRLTTLRETDPARLAWVVARRDRGGSSELTVQVRRFRSRLEWTGKVPFAIDERVIERVEQMADRGMGSDRACQWLADQVFLAANGADGRTRAIATGSPETGGRFRLLGARVGVDVAPQGEVLRVDAVVTIHGLSKGFRPPEFLIESDLEFVDATIAGQMRQSVRAQIERVIAESDSYIALWEKYEAIERENLIRRAREIGWVPYQSFDALPNGLWRFTAPDAEALSRFRHQLGAAGHEELEADREAPPEILEDARSLPEPGRERHARTAVGTVETIRVDRREVLLRPLDEESDILPPAKGVLFAALGGDRKRLERREQAVRRLKSADARLPQLALILEGGNPYVRRTDRVPAFTAAARKVFDLDPTPEQRLAIEIAVNTPDIVVIQGPPGTGKTKVITAIQARLAELEEERPAVAGRTLLTSFQHDAVDHAASKSLVFGLPPVRFGGRRGDRSSADEQVERWAVQAREHVEGELAHLPEERPLAQYRSVRDRAAMYASGRMSDEELRELLEELVGLPAGQIPTPQWERLRDLHHGPVPAASGTELERELMRKAVRGLRTTPEAFADDGPRKARQVLTRLQHLLADGDKELLEKAAAVAPGSMFAGLGSLVSLRDALLDRLNPGDVPGERRRVDPAILDVLNATVAALHDRMRESSGGAADALQEYAAALHQDPHGVRRLLEHYAAVYAATCQQAVGRHVVVAKGGEQADLEFENVIVDEAARANPLDLFIPMSLAKRRIILVGDHRQLPHLLDPDVEEALTGTVRAQEQHALEESLFQRLFERLPQLGTNDSFIRVVTLRDQFRMHPVLGEFVSDVFYEPHREGFRSPRPASDFEHDIAGYVRAGRPVCAAWRDVPRREGEEQPGRSKARVPEARWIAKELRRLLIDTGANVTIGVISFYRAQVDEILESLVFERLAERDSDGGTIEIAREWRTLEREDGSREERLRVGTVDAFQGKEFDVVFLSVTRSNAWPAGTEEERRRKFGHLMLENRLCVAMSRQRRLLVTVGDMAMFATAEARDAVPGLSRFLELCGGDHGLVA
jgi:hypothetical protein